MPTLRKRAVSDKGDVASVLMILLAIVTVVGLLWWVKVDQLNSSTKVEPVRFPHNSMVQRDMGNGWFIFEVAGLQCIYHYREAGYGTRECVSCWSVDTE